MKDLGEVLREREVHRCYNVGYEEREREVELRVFAEGVEGFDEVESNGLAVIWGKTCG